MSYHQLAVRACALIVGAAAATVGLVAVGVAVGYGLSGTLNR